MHDVLVSRNQRRLGLDGQPPDRNVEDGLIGLVALTDVLHDHVFIQILGRARVARVQARVRRNVLSAIGRHGIEQIGPIARGGRCSNRKRQREDPDCEREPYGWHTTSSQRPTMSPVFPSWSRSKSSAQQ